MNPPVRAALDRVPARFHRMVPSALRADLRDRTGMTAPGDLAYVPVPPKAAAGEETGPPDFAILGAPDAGCRWWMSLITDHPDVAPGHGSADVARFFAPYCTAPFDTEAIAGFHACFPRRPNRIIGFWSPDSLDLPWAPRLLADAAPEARILLLVRDPIERLLDGLDRTADDRAPHPGSYLGDAVDRGFYAMQLERLLLAYPAGQVCVLQYERCRADPVGSLARTFAHLGVDPSYRARPLEPSVHGSGPARDRLDARTLERLQGMYSADVAALVALVPDLDLSLWPNFTPRT